ncbi:MAG: arginyltransferase [Pseudomonadales bacterium]
MASLTDLQFFTTPAHDCSYIPGKQATTLVVDPRAKVDTRLYSSLASAGFRRSGPHIYRPYCQTCSACIPVRVAVADFAPKRRQQRIAKKNRDLRVSREQPSMNNENFALYRYYINKRHADGDMHPASRDQFDAFLVDGRPEASFYNFRKEEKLLAVAVADELQDGLSAIYTFFDPSLPQRSLGVYAILWLLEYVQEQGLDYLYLGYWIRQCRKMNYKTDFQPFQLLINNEWLELDSAVADH